MKNTKNPNIKLRYNTLNVIIYAIGIILLMQLFNLQIIHGAEYRETSNTRLTRESMLYATRGKILDANGNELATSRMMFTLEFYKTKLENDELNNVILKVLNTLEKNGDTYIDTFPIKFDTSFEYTFSNDAKKEAVIIGRHRGNNCWWFCRLWWNCVRKRKQRNSRPENGG